MCVYVCVKLGKREAVWRLRLCVASCAVCFQVEHRAIAFRVCCCRQRVSDQDMMGAMGQFGNGGHRGGQYGHGGGYGSGYGGHGAAGAYGHQQGGYGHQQGGYGGYY